MATVNEDDLELEDVAHDPVEEAYTDDPERLRELKLTAEGMNLAHFYLIDAKTLLKTASLKPDFLIEGALTRSSVNMFVGPPGSNKSWLGYDIVLAILHAREWLGFPAPRLVSPTAMVLNYDNPPAELAKRFLKLGLKPDDNVYFHSLGAHTPPEGLPYILQLPDTFHHIEAIVHAIKPDIILIDSHRQAHLFDDNDNQAMAIIMNMLRRLATVSKAAVIAIHHTRKEGDAIRGATEIEAGLDVAVYVDNGVATWGKTRAWSMLEPSRPFSVEDNEDETETRVIAGPTVSTVLANGPLTRSELAARLGVSVAALGPLLSRASDSGLIAEAKVGGERIIKLAE